MGEAEEEGSGEDALFANLAGGLPMYRNLFLTIEINLIFWIIAAFRTNWDPWIVVGLAVAAVLQHWAYYSLVKKGKDRKEEAMMGGGAAG